MTSFASELELALEAARLASARILELYKDFQAIPNARIDISTQADRDSQELILSTLLQKFPNDAYIAEENTPTFATCPRSGPRLWVIDPIDGTRGFAQKNGEFSVMIGLVQEHQVMLGVVMEPALGRLTFAVRGGGCWRKDDTEAAPCRVTAQSTLSASVLVQSHSRQPGPSKYARALGLTQVHETHSAGVKLARVARGDADLYVNDYPNFHDWDICAGHILVEEAGGRVTGMGGQPIRYGHPGAAQRLGLLATNGTLHMEAIEKLRGLF